MKNKKPKKIEDWEKEFDKLWERRVDEVLDFTKQNIKKLKVVANK